MPTRKYHVSYDVRAIIKLPDASLARMFTGTPSAVRTVLTIELARGYEKFPLARCDNFDPAHGCRGHDVVEVGHDTTV
jgi:hypothetical protein